MLMYNVIYNVRIINKAFEMKIDNSSKGPLLYHSARLLFSNSEQYIHKHLFQSKKHYLCICILYYSSLYSLSILLQIRTSLRQ